MYGNSVPKLLEHVIPGMLAFIFLTERNTMEERMVSINTTIFQATLGK